MQVPALREQECGSENNSGKPLRMGARNKPTLKGCPMEMQSSRERPLPLLGSLTSLREAGAVRRVSQRFLRCKTGQGQDRAGLRQGRAATIPLRRRQAAATLHDPANSAQSYQFVNSNGVPSDQTNVRSSDGRNTSNESMSHAPSHTLRVGSLINVSYTQVLTLSLEKLARCPPSLTQSASASSHVKRFSPSKPNSNLVLLNRTHSARHGQPSRARARERARPGCQFRTTNHVHSKARSRSKADHGSPLMTALAGNTRDSPSSKGSDHKRRMVA